MSDSRHGEAAGAWTLLFPLTYALHIAEEVWGGESFYGWVSRLWSIDLTRDEFLSINAVAMLIMIAGVLVANLGGVGMPIAALGLVTAFNGAIHAVASVATWSYSPGVVSGVLVWIPLGIYTLRRTHRALPRAQFYAGIVAGLLVHGLVSAAAFNS